MKPEQIESESFSAVGSTDLLGQITHRIADHGEMTHSKEVMYFNRLIIDLKLREMGKEPSEPITLERLQEATQHLQKISQCRKRTMFR